MYAIKPTNLRRVYRNPFLSLITLTQVGHLLLTIALVTIHSAQASNTQTTAALNSGPYTTKSHTVTHTPNTTPSMEVSFYNHSFAFSIQNIFSELISRALVITQKEYGDYTINSYPTIAAGNRVRELMQTGEEINLYFSSHNEDPHNSANSIDSQVPYLSAIMGQRMIIIHKNKKDDFDRIKSLNHLSLLSVGTGHNWSDKDVFTHNGLPHEKILTPDTMIDMLHKRRFDYLAPSLIDGAPQKLSQAPFDQDLLVLNDFVLYYPIPIHMHVSRSAPLLAQRLQKGFSIMMGTGEHIDIINRFLPLRAAPQDNNNLTRMLIINNPAYTAEENSTLINDFINLYPHKFNRLPH